MAARGKNGRKFPSVVRGFERGPPPHPDHSGGRREKGDLTNEIRTQAGVGIGKGGDPPLEKGR